MPIFAWQANIAGYSQGVFCYFPVISDQANGFSHHKKKTFRIASDLGVCDSNCIAHRGCIERFGPLRFRHMFCLNRAMSYFRNRKEAQGEGFRAGCSADVQADVWADILTQKLSSHRWECKKIQFSGDVLGPKARTSMTSGGLKKHFFNGVQTRCIVKNRLRKVHFSGDFLGAFDFLRIACALGIPQENL